MVIFSLRWIFSKRFKTEVETNYEMLLNRMRQTYAEHELTKKVKGKKIYLPKDMVYSLPSTEKQFTGNFPSGSYISLPKDMIVGVNWNNIKEHIQKEKSLCHGSYRF